jgi:L-lactate dehydrogenase complex protein LldE
MQVQLFIPCFMDQLYPGVAESTMQVLKKAGCQVEYNVNQTCCGQPAYNAGFTQNSKKVAEKFLEDFAGYDYIVSPSASCTGFVRNYYGKLFDNSSLHNEAKNTGTRMYELTDFLINILKIKTWDSQFKGKVTYHDSCAALRECKISSEPRQLLGMVPGVELVELENNFDCCGFGGTFAVKFEVISTAMADQKLYHAAKTKADYLVSTDISCLMHLNAYASKQNIPLQTIHIAEILAQ